MRAVSTITRCTSWQCVVPRRASSVYSCGEGFLGCLGHGDFAPREAPEPIAALQGIEPVRVAAGWGHSAVIDAQGAVHLFGRHNDFRNTMAVASIHKHVPWLLRGMNRLFGKTMVPDLLPVRVAVQGDAVRDAACSAGLTLLLMESGRVLCLGENFFGQCGVKPDKGDTTVFTPTAPLGSESLHFVQVAAGLQHGAALTDTGLVFCWGKGDRGQLGRGLDLHWSYQARVVDLPPSAGRAVQVGAGFAHTVALTESGDVFVWGKWHSKEQRTARAYQDTWGPRQLQVPCRIRGVQAGLYHTSLVGEDGAVYVVGMRGQGGEKTTTGLRGAEAWYPALKRPDSSTLRSLMTHEPELMTDVPPQHEGDVLRNSFHSTIRLRDGQVTMWGMAHPYMRAVGLDHLHVLDVSVGWRHTLLIATPRHAH